VAGIILLHITNSDNPHSAPISSARADIGGFKAALAQFKIGCGRYPTTEEGLAALIERPSAIPAASWRGPYLDREKIPADPWGHPFIYKCPGQHNTNGFDVSSLGPPGANVDYRIDNWPPSAYEVEQLSFAHEDLFKFRGALWRFQPDSGRFPTTEEGLAALTERPPAIPSAMWHGPYVGKIKDPWGHLYIYKCPGTHNTNGFDISSGGPNGRPGTAEEIGNWAQPR